MPRPDFLGHDSAVVAAIDCGENIWFPPLLKDGHPALAAHRLPTYRHGVEQVSEAPI